MSQSEKLAFRNGVMNTIIDKMETSIFDEASGRGTNLAFNIIKTPKNKELLRLTFPKGYKVQEHLISLCQNLMMKYKLKIQQILL